jgi:hypothetical protein
LIVCAIASFGSEGPTPALFKLIAQSSPQARPLTPDQLNSLVTPIALYPDKLLALVLAASTHPAQVVEANSWLMAQGNATAAQISARADSQPWDASVKAITAFPRVVALMDHYLKWTTDLGNAYYNQPREVMDAVQAIRRRTQATGHVAGGSGAASTTSTAHGAMPPPTTSSAIHRPLPPQASPSPTLPPPAHAVHTPQQESEASSATRRPASVPTPAANAAAEPASNEYVLGDELEKWKNGLQNGAIEYRVPPVMLAQAKSPVTVNIHGYQDQQKQLLPDATGTGALKVSSRMKVELLAPQNPEEFTIVSQGNDAIQFIPNDGFATWMWNVTPTYKAKDQQLQIRVSLVFDSPQGNVEQILQEQTYPVNVDVQNLGVTVARDFWKDPVAWFKYLLPGGAGWGALAALVTSLGGLTWWRKKKKKKAETD